MSLQYDSEGVPFALWGGKEIKIEKMKLTDDFYLEKARIELRETKENVKKGLEELRNLLKDEPNLVVPIEDDDFLLKFLRPCKFYAESAFKKIQGFYKYKQSHEAYCKDIMPSTVRIALEHSSITVLSPRDEHGRRVIIVESGDHWDPRKTPLTEMFRGLQLGVEAITSEPRTQVCGMVVILDMKGLTFQHVKQFSPNFAKVVVDWIQDSLPVRLKSVHVVNQPFIFNILYILFKPFVSGKLRSRLFLHGSDMNALLQHVDSASVMKRFGGVLPDDGLPGEVQWKILQHYEEDFRVANTYGYFNNS